jgi:hypothetical protein
MSEYTLHEIVDLTDPLLDLVAQDPVRPHIPADIRVGGTSRVLVLLKGQTPQSVVCVSFTPHVVTDESDLFHSVPDHVHVIMLYTIWSLQPGGGRRLMQAVRPYVIQNWPQVSRVVTLSPPTEMAEKFHLQNGARMLQHNGATVNFEYDLY